MPTSKDSPTPGETTAEVTGSSTNQPVISEGETSEAREAEVSEGSPDGLSVNPAPADVSGDLEKQYPPPPDEEESDVEALVEAEEEADAEPGEVWAKFTGPDVVSRGLTLADQLDLGIAEDRRISNVEEATPAGLEGPPLPAGLWFTKANRHRANVTGAHPELIIFLEEHADFEVTRY